MLSRASVMPRHADMTIACRSPPCSTMRATRRKQSASATLEPPNLCTVQLLSLIIAQCIGAVRNLCGLSDDIRARARKDIAALGFPLSERHGHKEALHRFHEARCVARSRRNPSGTGLGKLLASLRVLSIASLGAPTWRARIAALTRFVDAQTSSAKLLPVEPGDGAVWLTPVHLHETETAWPAGLAIGDELDGLHLPILLEKLPNLIFRRAEWQVSHVDCFHCPT